MMATANDTEIKYDILCDANNLIDAFRSCKKGSIWKCSVQRYEMNYLRNVNQQVKAMQEHNYTQQPFNEFTLSERGKTREIKAIHIEDRVILRNLCDNILTPSMRKYFIYDNGASLEGKGIQFTRDRLVTHLHKYYREHQSNDGYILMIDFTKFFDNVQHDKLIEEYDKRIDDKEIMDFIKKIIQCFEIDVSYMDDNEYKYCLDSIFNAIEYSRIDKSLLTGEKFMKKSIGIGSQISQISGLLYPTRIDNYCKIVKGLKYYGRYMDDTYIIHESREYLQQLLKEIEVICSEYGIHINMKKTQIVKLSKTFPFLKNRYTLTASGKVIQRPNKKCFTRERRKLKKFRKLLDEGKMTFRDIDNQYGSWRGTIEKIASYHSLKNMDMLYAELFSTEKEYKRYGKYKQKSRIRTGNQKP